jgi:hypothetical protein
MNEEIKKIEERIKELENLILRESNVSRQELYRATLKVNLQMLKLLTN